MGPGGFFPTNPDLAEILGDADFDFENFYFLYLLDPKFPDFQVPDFQISRNLAWAGLGYQNCGYLTETVPRQSVGPQVYEPNRLHRFRGSIRTGNAGSIRPLNRTFWKPHTSDYVAAGA